MLYIKCSNLVLKHFRVSPSFEILEINVVDVAYCDFLIRDVNSYKIDLQYTVNTNQILNCFILKKPLISWPPLLNFFKRTTSGTDLVLTGELYCLVKILTANWLRSINCHALMVIPFSNQFSNQSQSVFQSTANMLL